MDCRTFVGRYRNVGCRTLSGVCRAFYFVGQPFSVHPEYVWNCQIQRRYSTIQQIQCIAGALPPGVFGGKGGNRDRDSASYATAYYGVYRRGE
eukprot:6877288-Prymnesium_polylepis.1